MHRIQGKKDISRHDLELYIKQKPNKKIIGLRFSLYAYYFGKYFFDTAKVISKTNRITTKYNMLIEKQPDSTKKLKLTIKKNKKLEKQATKLEQGNWWMRNVGEAPSFYDTTLAYYSSENMAKYMRSKGYLNAKATYRADTVFNSIFLNYLIDAGDRYRVDSLSVRIYDGNLKRIYNENIEDVIIKTNSFYDEDLLTNERTRLESLFKQHGYFDFVKEYISYELDTANQTVSIKTIINNPEGQMFHKTYSVSGINVNIDNTGIAGFLNTDTLNLSNINFYYGLRYYKPKYIKDKMLIKPNERYDFSKVQQSIKNLNQLDVFKFVSLHYDKTSANEVLVNIKANSTSKYQISDELGVGITQGLPGPFGSITYAARNVFNGCEIFDMSARAGIEGVGSVSDADNIYSSYEASFSSSLTFPRLFLTNVVNKIFVNNNPRTRFLINYNYILRPEYQRSITRTALIYELNKMSYNSYALSLIDINYINTPFISTDYFNRLETQRLSGDNLFRSFQTAVASNLNFAYIFNNYQPSQYKKARYLRIYTESGGTSQNLLGTDLLDRFRKSLNLNAIYIYLKASADFRAYIPTGTHAMFATRAFLGIANPYAGDGVLPYEKYFFAGGSNGIRAWLPRRLGPGSYDGNLNYSYEQPGLIHVELNNEYRFKVVGVLAAAVFVDTGNVWLLNDIETEKNFKRDFYTEIAVGTGYGIRLDFSFLLVRLDAGLKLYDPAKPLPERLLLSQYIESPEKLFFPLWNIAIGYPF